MIDVDIPVADEHGFHTRLGIDALRELAADLQHDVLLTSSFRPDGAWILAAVTGIDGNDDVAARPVALGGSFHGLEAARFLQVNDEPVVDVHPGVVGPVVQLEVTVDRAASGVQLQAGEIQGVDPGVIDAARDPLEVLVVAVGEVLPAVAVVG